MIFLKVKSDSCQVTSGTGPIETKKKTLGASARRAWVPIAICDESGSFKTTFRAVTYLVDWGRNATAVKKELWHCRYMPTIANEKIMSDNTEHKQLSNSPSGTFMSVLVVIDITYMHYAGIKERNYIGMAVMTLFQYPALIWAESPKPSDPQSATIARFSQ